MRRVLCLAGLFAALCLAAIVSPLPWAFAAPLDVPAVPRHAAVIVLLSSGELDPPWLTTDATQRLLGALDLWRRGFAPVIVASGSQHESGLDQAEFEANWLGKAGVPGEAIVVESRSTRTYTSILALRELMEAHGWKDAVIVTSRFDVPRVRAVCRKLGIDASFLAVPIEGSPGGLIYWSGFDVLHHALYEYAGLAFYWLKGWI